MQSHTLRKAALVGGLALVLNLAVVPTASAHCDSMDGPVITEAREALASGDVTPVLKWVPAADSATVRQEFEAAREVRALGPEARRIADRHFFATLVRIHRASEGAPFTGIKPAGGIEPAVSAADGALAAGDIDPLIGNVRARLETNIRERFEAARAARAKADRSVEDGREFVRRYVEYVHYVERVHGAIGAPSGHAH